ncbi:unnamed protein product [Arctogadus glacialis]
MMEILTEMSERRKDEDARENGRCWSPGVLLGLLELEPQVGEPWGSQAAAVPPEPRDVGNGSGGAAL